LIQRIHGRHAFDILSRDGRRIRRSSLWCSWCPQPNSNVTGVAYSIGRACGPAVTRNRLRRRLRTIVRQFDEQRTLPSGLLLVGARASATELTFDQLRQQAEELLRSLDPPVGEAAS
jgi:ribonuclease P protein component